MPDNVRGLVFLSYAHEDLDRVRRVYEGLKKKKVNAWFDKVDLGPGRWKDRIEKAISRSKYFIFCLSEASLKKTGDENPGFVDKELQIAWKFASEQDETVFTIIPVRLEDCGRGDMRLSGWNQYDLYEDWEGTLDSLAVNIGGNSLEDAMAVDERTEDDKIFDSIMGKAEMLYYSGEYEKAFSHFKFAADIKPDSHQAWYNKGVVLGKLGRREEALEAYNKAIEFKPDYHDAWYNLACLFSIKKEKGKALEYLRKAIDSGFNDFSLIKTDNDLDFIRNEKEFQEIINR